MKVQWTKIKDIDGMIHTATVDGQIVASIQRGFHRGMGTCWVISGTQLTVLGNALKISGGETTLAWAKNFVEHKVAQLQAGTI